jgi:DNA invertase Pin-like site-specific DNA recombinase
MERDIILERLEKKLAEKEKEVEELRKMLSSKSFEDVKKELSEELKKEIKTLEAKVLELSKTVETLMSEVLFIKSELKKCEKGRDLIEVGLDESEDKEVVETKPRVKRKTLEIDEDIIVID